MKISADRADAFSNRPDAKARAVLVYGPDEGLVRERAQRLMRTVVSELNDPFRVADLVGSQVKNDPALLIDEAAALSMTGGRRVVRLRDADDGHTKAVQAFLESPPGDALVVLQAGDLAAKSSLRKLCESALNAAAIACYMDDGQAVELVIRDSLGKFGISIAPEALDLMASQLGSDRQVTRAEVEKLITYMGGPDARGLTVTLDDIQACVGDLSALSMDDMTLALADGDDSTAQAMLDRFVAEGQSMIPLLRSVTRHFLRLHLVSGALAHGKPAEQAVALLKPPLFFKTKPRFMTQVRRWPTQRITQVLDLLLDAEMDCKSTGAREHEIVSRVFLQISHASRVAKPTPSGP
ncbi:DNA polymerase III subunit delta [Insolitispirillum peregrinum]|uniref:DNA polymerase III subunit delta n=1 Tax=Insolitispirillum peregrinum TaxID=80876 RepID=A0A1N7JJ30_9PROT|nr:DNA polymerase III subunit delta [Insolitispirillum peregrinum]SIS49335.1 DNA polymerase III, delta subunit [Insolitispirillum peregrinum]